MARVERENALGDSDAGLPTRQAFERWVSAALAPWREDGTVHVRIVDHDESQALNARWRGKRAPTNVLAFPVDLPPGIELDLLGDLVICAPVVSREAGEQGKAADAHWAHMTVHGALHLMGFDHGNDAEAEVMEAEERRALARLGLGDPYAL